MTTTPQIGLSKPAAGANTWDVDLNGNADILDGEFHATTGHDHSGATGHGPNLPQSSVTGLVSALAGKQASDADLTTIAGLTATTDNFMQAKASAWASRTPTQVTADLIAVVGDTGSGGTKGLVPAPGAGDAAAGKFLKADGTFAIPAGSGMSNPMTTQDDLIVGGAAGAPARLAKGTDGQVLTVDPTTHHLVWATPSGGGGSASISRGADASRPAAGTAGTLYLPTDGFAAHEDNGTNWRQWGPLFPLTAPVDGDFAWINQGGASVVAQNSGIFLSAPNQGAADNLRIRKKAAPSTPYTITAYVIPAIHAKNYQGCGLCWRQSSDGKLVTLDQSFVSTNTPSAGLGVGKLTNPTTFSASYVTVGRDMFWPWLRLRDDGTTRYAYVSRDGQDWILIHSVGRTDFLTADEVGFWVNCYNAATPNLDAGMTVLSWDQA